MIAELLEAFGNRLHPRFVVSFQLWLFPSHFGTTYLSPSVNPRLFLYQEGQKGLQGLFEQHESTQLLAPQDWARLLNCSTGKNSSGTFSLTCTCWEQQHQGWAVPPARSQAVLGATTASAGTGLGFLGQNPLSWFHGSCVALCTLKSTLSGFFEHRELGGFAHREENEI